MSFKSNTKTSLSKGKGRSLVKHTNVSKMEEESSIAQTATTDIQGDINPIANGVKHVKELQSTSQVNSKYLKEQFPTQHQSQSTPTNHETPTTPTNQILTQEIGMKRKLEEQGDEVKAKKSKEDVDNDETDEPTYVYEYKNEIVVIDPKEYMNDYVKKNGHNYMKTLSLDYSCWDNIALSSKLGFDVFKQSAYALALVPTPRNFDEYTEMRYPLAFFLEKFISCVPNTYAIKGINFVNGVEIIDCFKWLHAIANATDFEDFVKIILGSSCLADRHRTKGYNKLIFSDFVLRRLAVAFLGYFANNCEVARSIMQAKDEDIDFNAIHSQIMNEVIRDDCDDKYDIWDF